MSCAACVSGFGTHECCQLLNHAALTQQLAAARESAETHRKLFDDYKATSKELETNLQRQLYAARSAVEKLPLPTHGNKAYEKELRADLLKWQRETLALLGPKK